MNILLVDDEQLALAELEDVTREIMPKAWISCVDNYVDALATSEQTRFDVAILDIEMPGMNGIELAKRMKQSNSDINIIFSTAYTEYAVDAFGLYASSYLLKPVRKQEMEQAFQHLRYPVCDVDEKLQIQCFGNFEVFYQGEPMQFGRSRAKEIFAYLVDRRGAASNTNEICTILWENSINDTSKKHYFRNLIADLKKTLRQYGVEDILICKRNQFSINVKLVECDYYKFLESDTEAIKQYYGEYMNQYSWAVRTIGYLEHYEKIFPGQ